MSEIQTENLQTRHFLQKYFLVGTVKRLIYYFFFGCNFRLAYILAM